MKDKFKIRCGKNIFNEILLWLFCSAFITVASSILLKGGVEYYPSIIDIAILICFIVTSMILFKEINLNNTKLKKITIIILSLVEICLAIKCLKITVFCTNIQVYNLLLNYLLILITTSLIFFVKRKITLYFSIVFLIMYLSYIFNKITSLLMSGNLSYIAKSIIYNMHDYFSSISIVIQILFSILAIGIVVFLFKKEKLRNKNIHIFKFIVFILLIFIIPIYINVFGKMGKLSIQNYNNSGSIYTTMKLVNRNIKLSSYKVDSTDGVPVIYFDGDFNGISKDNKKNVKIKYDSKENSFEGYTSIKWQGTSSLSYPKKNYTIKLYKDKSEKEKLKVNFKNWGEENKFCLKANYIDFTQARNVVSARIAGSLESENNRSVDSPNNGCIDGFPVKVVINGLYQGLYTLNIPKDGWMFGMDEDNPNHMVWCAEQQSGSCEFRNLAEGNEEDWSLEFPKKQSDYNLAALNRVIEFVKDSSDEEFITKFEEYFDKEATFNYYIFQYFSCGIDGLAKNMLMVTYDGKVWYPSLYDMDSTWGLYWDGSKLLSYDTSCPDEYESTNSLLWERVEKLFEKDLYKQYKALRLNQLSEDNIIKEFEQFKNESNSKLYDIEKEIWPDTPSKDITSFEQIEDFVKNRAIYVDKCFEEKFK